MAQFKLVVGLGNPTQQYQETRHNAGFWFVDRLASLNGLTFSLQSRRSSEVAQMTIDGEQILLLKPTTFMNHSGRAVTSVAKYFDITPDQILVVHDELDFQPGDIRLKRGGGHGGHNGLKDIASGLGSREFYRLRLGIGRPAIRDDVVRYVLGRPSAGERQAICESIARGIDCFPQIIAGKIAEVMNELHSSK